MCLLLYMVHKYDSMIDYYPRHIYRMVVKSLSSFSQDAHHTVPAYPIYETCLLLSTSSLWVFQPSAHYPPDSHKLLPFWKFINLTHSDTFIHGPFDFSTINNRKSRDRICQSDWDILKSHCDLFHNPLPRFDVPTYSVHVDAGAHTTFYSAALSGDLFSSAQRTLHTPRQRFTIDKRSLESVTAPIFFSFSQ